MRWIVVLLSLVLAAPGVRAADPETLTIGFGAAISSLDPMFHTLTPNNQIAQHFFDPLILQDEQQRLLPGLAESWRALDDTHWEFKLRRGVTFHDGSDFTAADVLASYKRVPAVPNSPGPFTIYLRGILKTEAPDPYTLRITTDGPVPLLPNMLSRIYVISRTMAEATTAEFNAGRAVIGTGPFKLVEYVPGDRIVMARNDAYWGGAPPWRQVVFRMITNATARTAALRSGDVQLIDRVPIADIPRLKADAGFTIESKASNRVIFLQFDVGREGASPFVTDKAGKPLATNPLRDRRVRQALSRAINRQALVERVLGDEGIPAGQFLPDGFFGVSPRLKPDPFDPDGAKALLRDAGFPDGFALTLHGPNDRYIEDAKTLQAVAQMWSRIGVESKVETLPFAGYAGRGAHQEFSVFMLGWGSGTGEVTSPLQSMIATADAKKGMGTSNWGRYSNPAFDQLFEHATAIIDDEKREQALQRAVEMAIADVPLIPLHFEVSTWALRRGLAYKGRADQYTLAAFVRPSP
ncbi:MAG: ABC transporter substrate-binding protein [Alphaproteobacteria bacterium]|nr:ABC transporter substrate-binding protein [Alphaproteobacteria bacterium]